MLARLQQLTTLCLVAMIAGWLVRYGSKGEYAVAAIVPIGVFLGYSLVIGAEYLMLAWTGWRRREATPGWRTLAWAWINEVTRTPLVFCWRQPFRSRAEPDRIASKAGVRGVVFVHGFVSNRGLWNPWLRKLRRLEVPFAAVNLEPVFGSIDSYANCIDQAVRALHVATGLQVIVVAHSMGGLAVRAWLRNRPDGEALVKRIVTIATPHRGTLMARHAKTENGRQMYPQSRWLQALGHEETAERRAKFICFYGNCDNIVVPASTALLDGADNRLIPAVAHVQMVYHPIVFDEVARWLPVAPLRNEPSLGKHACSTSLDMEGTP